MGKWCRRIGLPVIGSKRLRVLAPSQQARVLPSAANASRSIIAPGRRRTVPQPSERAKRKWIAMEVGRGTDGGGRPRHQFGPNQLYGGERRSVCPRLTIGCSPARTWAEVAATVAHGSPASSRGPRIQTSGARCSAPRALARPVRKRSRALGSDPVATSSQAHSPHSSKVRTDHQANGLNQWGRASSGSRAISRDRRECSGPARAGRIDCRSEGSRRRHNARHDRLVTGGEAAEHRTQLVSDPERQGAADASLGLERRPLFGPGRLLRRSRPEARR